MKTDSIIIIVALIVILLINVSIASATIRYPYLDCEKVAKDNAKIHSMGLVFIAEKYDNGEFKHGEYVGHW